MNKLLIVLLLLTSCEGYDPQLASTINLFEKTQEGRVCFSVYAPEELIGRYCLEKIK